MRTLQHLKDEVAGLVEKEYLTTGHGDFEKDLNMFLDAFMDVVEANGGTIKFSPPPPPGPAKTVEVGMAGEKSGAGRKR